MTLSLSKLMAVADTCSRPLANNRYWVDGEYETTFDPPTVKRLLAIAEAAKEVASGNVINSEPTPGALKALRASLEGVEL